MQEAGRVEGRDRRWSVLWSVLAGLFSVNIVFTLFAVAQDRIARDLGTDVNGLTWAITLPLLAFGVAAPTAGKVGDIVGHRRTYLVGMAGSLLAAILTALAPNVGVLVLVRTVGQILGGATGSASMAIIFRVFDREERVKAMGWWSLIGAGGPVIGVVVGGPIVESVGWRWVFWGQVPLIIASALVASRVLPRTTRAVGAPRPRFDVAGTVLLALGVTALLFGLNRGPAWGWTSPAVLACFATAPVALALFVGAERRAAEPLLPLRWLARRNFTLGVTAQAFTNFAYMGGFILAPRLLDRVFDLGESSIGFISIARPLTFSLMAPIAGYLAVVIGERVSAVVGGLGVVASMVGFSALTAGTPLPLVVLCFALSGFGMGTASPSVASSVANVVEEESMGVASAVQQLMSQVGLVAGIQLMSTVQTARQDDGLVGSFATAYRLGAGVALCGVVAASFLVRAQRTRTRAAGEPDVGSRAAAATR